MNKRLGLIRVKNLSELFVGVVRFILLRQMDKLGVIDTVEHYNGKAINAIIYFYGLKNKIN